MTNFIRFMKPKMMANLVRNRTMKYLSIITLGLLFTNFLPAQQSIIDLMGHGENLKEENKLLEYQDLDFSNLWLHTANRNVFGMIGENHKRLKIKIISVNRTLNKIGYTVYGKSCVDGNICDFYGTILITKILLLKDFHYGVDDELKDSGIKDQGIIIATYKFEENIDQTHSGVFTGQLVSRWYINSSRQLKYDDIELHSDRYMNNAFVGNWTAYNSTTTKICNWGDYRLPFCKADFDIGAGEFSPSKKYYSQGWENYQKAWLYNDKEAQQIELAEWWK